jgi:glycolate oxidase FAD binding subunit
MPSDPTRPANGAATIDSLLVSEIIVPSHPQEAADMLAAANSRGKAVAPIGGGTALGMGNLPERIDLALSTSGLAGIIDYEPTDLVLSVGAGSRLGDVQAVLGEHGQRLPIDPPGGADATIGGLIATARWGPLRYSAGTFRDLLIGISVAHPSGTVSKAGGMVVKNVSGYDMPRLYLGSLGTLGVIVSANFKVLPKPRTEATIVATYPSAAGAFAAARLLHVAQESLAALEVARLDGVWTTAARIEGREPTVDMLAKRIATIITGEVSRLDATESAAWWAAYVARQQPVPGDDTVLVRCGARPRETATLAEGIVAALENLGIAVTHLAASPGIGVALARLDLGSDGSADRLAEVQALLLGLSDTATILAAPSPWKQGLDVWGRLPEGFEVMESLRAEFDPARTVNPGRFAGFL